MTPLRDCRTLAVTQSRPLFHRGASAGSPGDKVRPAEHRWRQPPAQWPLRLDQVALAAALAAGPAAAEGHRVYVSRATLVVVPPTLVGHWTHQIARHTVPGEQNFAARDGAVVQRMLEQDLSLEQEAHTFYASRRGGRGGPRRQQHLRMVFAATTFDSCA